MQKALYKLLSRLLLKKKFHLIKGLAYLNRETKISLDRLDYVRIATLELIAYEISSNNIEGSVAELGVYKGGFAKYINEVFAERKFFLFDTFEGFMQEDVEKEKQLGIKPSGQDFSNTSIEKVLALMPHPGNCIVKKGMFPQTFAGMEKESFCFVSIDADLYEPVKKGLELFYAQLVPKGYLMIHDFNNDHYPGCRKAVEEFCTLHKIACVPLSDMGGSVVIQKT